MLFYNKLIIYKTKGAFLSLTPFYQCQTTSDLTIGIYPHFFSKQKRPAGIIFAAPRMHLITIDPIPLIGRRLLVMVVCALALQMGAGSLRAAIIDWDGSSSTTFSTGGNWSTNSAPSNSTTTDIARFGSIAFTNQPTLTASRSINGLIFAGNATVTLSGSTNTLTIGSSGINDQSTSGTQTVSTLLSLAANQSFTNSGNLTITGNIANSTRLLTLTGTGAGGLISGVIGSGSGGITKSGTGTWTLSRSNTYTGATTISAGTLVAAANSALGTTGGATTVNSGGTLGFQGGINYSTAEAVTINGTGAAGRSGAIDNISGTNTFAGPITVATNAQIGATAGALTLNGAINLSASATADRTLSFNPAGATAITVNGKLSDALNASFMLNVAQVGNGTVTLANGTSDYWGNTSVGTAGGTTTGTLALGANNALPTINNASAINVYSGTLALNNFNATAAGTLNLGGGGAGSTAAITTGTGTLTLNGDVTYDATNNPNGATVAGNLALGSDRIFTINDSTAAASDLTVSAAISGTNFGITKEGAGTMVLSGTNTYTGVTTINAGTLSVGTIGNGGVAGNLGAATNTAANLVLGGGTLQYTGSTAGTDRNFTLSPGTTSTIDVTTAATNLTLSGSAINTTGGITKAGAGTLTLAGTNLYTGTTTVNAGTLLAQGSASLGDTTGNVTVSGGTLALAGGAAITAGSPTNAQTITKSGTLSLSGSGATASTGALHAAGSTGQTSQWLGNITLAANATISAADNLLIVGDGTSYANTLNLNGNTLTFNTTSAAGVTPVYLTAPTYVLDSSNILVNSQISGTGGIVKTGAGTLNLISFPSNSYTGSTVVTGGKLVVDGAGNAPVISSTSVTVGNSTGPGAADSVVLQMGQGSSPSVNQIVGTYNSGTNVASTSMTVYSDGLFNMNGGSNALANLTLQGGHVNMGGLSALLTVTGGITANAASQTALINNGYLGMSANAFTFNVAKGTAPTDLQVDSVLQNGVGFTNSTSSNSLVKTGAGTLLLTGANTYQGVTDIQAGVIAIQNSAALGANGSSAANGTTVRAGAQLQLDGSTGNLTVANESLTLYGNGTSTTGELRNTGGSNTYNGFITLGGDSRINADTGSALTIASTSGTAASIINGDAAGRNLTLGGAGNIAVNSVIASNIGTLTKDGTGTVTLAGDYAANATTTVKDGTLTLNMGNGGLNNAATVTIGDGVGTAGSATLLLAQSNQIADTAAVTLGSDGLLNVNSKAETIGSIAGSGKIILGTGQIIAGGNNSSTAFSGTLTGGATSSLTKAGSGTLTISSNVNAVAGDFTGALNLTGGTLAFNVNNAFSTVNISAGTTLRLTDATLNIASLNFTGNGSITLDFSGTASILNVTNLNIASGVTLNIINWQNAADYFYAANWTGAVVDVRGVAPENQVVFDAPTWTGNDTKWQGYDHQITPVPEPSTYGALLLGAMGALLGYRRFRKSGPATAPAGS